MEDALKWPILIKEAEQQIRETDQIAGMGGSADDRLLAATLEREARQAIEIRDVDVLRRKLSELHRLASRLHSQCFSGGLVQTLDYLRSRRDQMSDAHKADQLFAQVRQAIQNNDLPALISAIQQLRELLPPDDWLRPT